MFSKGKSRRSNYHSNHRHYNPAPKRATFDKSTKEYGTLPIHKAKFDKKEHPNVVVEKNKKSWLTVGIQSGNSSGHHKLAKVYESRGEIGYMQHHVNDRKPSEYREKAENWHIDKESENRAKSLVEKYKAKK